MKYEEINNILGTEGKIQFRLYSLDYTIIE